MLLDELSQNAISMHRLDQQAQHLDQIKEGEQKKEQDQLENSPSREIQVRQLVDDNIFFLSPIVRKPNVEAGMTIDMEQFKPAQFEEEASKRKQVFTEAYQQNFAPQVIKDNKQKRSNYVCHVIIRQCKRGSFVFYIRMILRQFKNTIIRKVRDEVWIKGGRIQNIFKVIKRAKALSKKGDDVFKVFIYK